ncbi:hypothetical protein CDL15_Pgr024989 [Punica granatum]|uniref:Triosephosphate isomerase, cytosolic n=1 Tax=Punica granatum TaxID=22663 RepID=A0A218W9Q3_PUNGR|nr:hypothetical protein CDL15_Pgr024989 [Punica granatum]
MAAVTRGGWEFYGRGERVRGCRNFLLLAKASSTGFAAAAAPLRSLLSPINWNGTEILRRRQLEMSLNLLQNGTLDEVKKIVSILNEAEVPPEDVVEVVVSPPFVFLPLVKSLLRSDFSVAAQNCWVRRGGAFTGEISAEMLINSNIPWVIVGHSERRLLLNESNEFVGDKVAYALLQGLKVIACVGETLEQRESGSTMNVVAAQTKAIADRVSHWENIVLAYEPVWAIGTGKVATPAQAQEARSVNGANCEEQAAQPDVDGFLVGGASLKPEFIDIIKSATVKKK